MWHLIPQDASLLFKRAVEMRAAAQEYRALARMMSLRVDEVTLPERASECETRAAALEKAAAPLSSKPT